jgi:pimeloyl-ACP methyl ester carboxylesterase
MHQSTTYNRAAAVALMLLLTGAASHAQDNGRKSEKRPKPFTLREQGSFYVGGSIVFRDPNSTTVPDPRFGPGDIAVNHMYVQYQVPENRKYRYPIIMMHGGGHTAKVYETTPDGREGWYTSFMRRGFAAYAVDAPNRGRSGYDPTQRYKVYLGLAAPSTLEIGNIYSAQAAWIAFRVGPTYGVQYPGQQFPVEYFSDYIKQSLPSYRDATQNPKIASDLVALIDKVGPCILLGWSTGTSNVMNAAVQRPNLVKGVIGIEGAPPSGGVDVNTLAKIPVFVVFGDNTSPAGAKAFTDQLRALGGDASTVWLPDVGIRGNGHTMMAERNNEKIADLIENWIVRHVSRVRGSSRSDD